jgi:hypothetical protein
MPADFPEEANEQDLKRIQYPLVFSTWCPEEKWEKSLKEYALSAQDFLRARRKELDGMQWAKAKKVELEASRGDDDIPF